MDNRQTHIHTRSTQTFCAYMRSQMENQHVHLQGSRQTLHILRE